MVLILGLAGCKNDKEVVFANAALKKSLHCKMERLDRQNDSLWNEMSVYLDRELPQEMSSTERQNMVNIRNANLISMHKVFPTLDTSIQNTVMAAGKTDEKIAEEMKTIMKKLEDVDEKLNIVLEKIENRNKDEYQQLRLQIQEYKLRPCI